MKVHKLDIDPNDTWAEVELYRWQHGELPRAEDEKPLDIPTAMRAMAKALEINDEAHLPTPFNVASVLRYAAKQTLI